MILHEARFDKRGAGKWDARTTRYIPQQGGSRFRLPIRDSETIPRYPGFVGVDERMSGDMKSVHALYSYLGGRPIIPPGAGGDYIKMLIDLSLKWMKPEEGEEAA